MLFWIALASSAFCGWFVSGVSARLTRYGSGPATFPFAISPWTNRIEVSSGWSLIAGLGVGLVLTPLLADLLAAPVQQWWPRVYLVVASGTLVAFGSRWVVLHWLDSFVRSPWDTAIPAVLVAVAFMGIVAVTRTGGVAPPSHLLLVALVVGALVWMLAPDGPEKLGATPGLGLAFMYGLAQVIASPEQLPMAASISAGALVATALPQPNARIRPISFWGQSAIVVFIASDALLQGAWVALALAAITAVGLSVLVKSFESIRGTHPVPRWDFWASAGLALCGALVITALDSVDSKMAIGVGLSVLVAVVLLSIAASRDILSAPFLAARGTAALRTWSGRELTQAIRKADTCHKLWQVVLRSHSAAGMVSVKWQLPGLCFETASQERDPDKQWMVSVPLAPSAWIEAEWDPTQQYSLHDATAYLTQIAERASVLSLQHIEALFDDPVDSDATL